MTHHIELDQIHLDSGNHHEDGRGCVMNWVARFAGEDVSDHPVCTSPVLTAFAIAFNDGLDDERRQRLIPFIPRLVGTSGDKAADEIRAWMAADWLVRVFTPTWLRKAGLTADADALVALPELSGPELAKAAQPIIDAARANASAAWIAAGDAAWAAAWIAAWIAAGAAAWIAAWIAAGDAAWIAAWAAARAAAGDAAWIAAWAAARAAAWIAARAAAGDAAGDAAWIAARIAAGDAAGDAARAAASKKKGYSAQYDAAYRAARPIVDAALGETAAELIDQATDLLDRMIDVKVTVPA